jgi:histidine triad (HIT) family protein
MKKICILFLSIQGISFGYCAFCDEKVLEAQVFYKGDLVLGFCTHKPVVPGHCLIIPKRHVERFEMLSDAEVIEIAQVIKKVNQAVMISFQTMAYVLLEKNGKEAGQTVPHVHFHYMPKKAGENSAVAFMAKMLMANLKSPLQKQEMEEMVQKMKKAVN